MRRLLASFLPLALLAMLSQASSLRLVLLSDFNGAYGSIRYPAAVGPTLRRIVDDWKPQAVVSAGDLIAAQKSSQTDAQVRAMWAAFEREVRSPLEQADIPFIFTLGNHDASLPRDRREAAAYWQKHAPKLTYVDRSAFPFHYSLTLENVFIVVLDAAGPQVDASQRQWLAAQLATPQARAARYRLVMGHLPLAGVSREKNKAGELIGEARALRKVMELGHVTAYIHGHHAAYYAGKLGQLDVLSSGGIGGRDYAGYPGTARSVVTVLEVTDAGIRLLPFDADTGRPLDPGTLPPRIDGLGGPLLRVEELGN